MIHHYKDETFLIPLWRKILDLPPKLILSWIQNIPRFCFHIFTYISSYKHLYFEMWIAYSLSVQFSGSVMSDSLGPNGLQHNSLSCPSSTPRTCSNSCLSRWWCHSTISSSVMPFTFCLQSFIRSFQSFIRSFLMSQLFASGGQSIGASASASVLPKNIQSWFP